MCFRSQALALLTLLACTGCRDPGVDAYDAALAALQANELREADVSGEEAAALGRPEGGFVRGNAAFAECLLVERQAAAPGAEPFIFDLAITYAQKALRFWRYAAMSKGGDDWPAARRNVERALLKIAELKAKQKARQDQRKSTDPKPKPKPKPNPGKTKPDPQKDPKAEQKPQLVELSPEQVKQLMDKLIQKQREKIDMRRTERAKTATATRDW